MSAPPYLSGKPQTAEADARALLRQHFSAPIEELSVLPGGEIAQIYAFVVSGNRYILRIAPPMGASLEKERFIQRLLAASLAASSIPIPPVLHTGQLGAPHYAIARRMPGTPLSKLPPREYVATIPALLDMLDAIHAVDVRATTGYGVFDGDGTGPHLSWRASLVAASAAWPATPSGALACPTTPGVSSAINAPSRSTCCASSPRGGTPAPIASPAARFLLVWDSSVASPPRHLFRVPSHDCTLSGKALWGEQHWRQIMV